MILGYVTARFGKKKPRKVWKPAEISRLVRVSEGHLGKAGIMSDVLGPCLSNPVARLLVMKTISPVLPYTCHEKLLPSIELESSLLHLSRFCSTHQRHEVLTYMNTGILPPPSVSFLSLR